MDPNLLYWKAEGQSFVCRLKIWVNLLDPTLLLSSDPEIKKAHSLLGSGEKLNEKDEAALTVSLSSVHPDSGAALPLIFRPPGFDDPLNPLTGVMMERCISQVFAGFPLFWNHLVAFFPVTGPLVVASLLPHSTVKPALFWQFLLQSYSAGFNFANRNSSSEQGQSTSLKQLLLITGTISYSACAGALPQIFISRLGIRSPAVQTFFRSILPIPLSATLAFFNLFTVRSEEAETGIQVFDHNGNPVGMSKAAGEKAVRETALSRAALFGMTAAVPNLLVLLMKRARPFQRNSLLVAPLRHISTALVLGLMIPISFSLFPQLGTINREQLEEELQAAAVGRHLFYHRGL